MYSCLSTDQMDIILDLHLQSKWYWFDRWLYEKIPFNEELKVGTDFDKHWWVVGGWRCNTYIDILFIKYY